MMLLNFFSHLIIGVPIIVLTVLCYPTFSEANTGPYQLVSEINSNAMSNGQSTGIFVDSNFNIFVTLPSLHRIEVFNQTGHNVHTNFFGQPELPVDSEISARDGKVYFIDMFLDRVKIAQGSTPLTIPFPLDNPCGLDIDDDGNLIIRERTKILKLLFPSWTSSSEITTVNANTNGIESCPIEEANQSIYYTRNSELDSTNINFNPQLPPNSIIGDIASDNQGNIFVMTSPWEIQKLNRNGDFITGINFGEKFFSNHTGTFWNSKIAIDSKGTIYVLDSTHGKVLMFRQGGPDSAQFQNPNGIAARSFDIYVADPWNNRIQKFTNTGDFVNRWGHGDIDGINDNILDLPDSVAVDLTGKVFVTGFGGDQRIQKFTANGFFITQWRVQSGLPIDIAVDSAGNVYVSSFDNTIQKFTNDGTFIKKWGSTCMLSINNFGCLDPDGTGPLSLGDGQFDFPKGIAVDFDNNVYVADTGNDRIQKFTNDGTFIKKWGSSGESNSKFNAPRGVAVDFDTGNVIVADTDNQRIQKFTNGGLFLTKWGFFGEGDGQFNFPSDVTVDSDGNVYVADTDNDRIQKFTNDGTFIKKWGSEGNS
jgi:DNA-binding beta-propeller fold protein YncE